MESERPETSVTAGDVVIATSGSVSSYYNYTKNGSSLNVIQQQRPSQDSVIHKDASGGLTFPFTLLQEQSFPEGSTQRLLRPLNSGSNPLHSIQGGQPM